MIRGARRIKDPSKEISDLLDVFYAETNKECMDMFRRNKETIYHDTVRFFSKRLKSYRKKRSKLETVFLLPKTDYAPLRIFLKKGHLVILGRDKDRFGKAGTVFESYSKVFNDVLDRFFNKSFWYSYSDLSNEDTRKCKDYNRFGTSGYNFVD